MIFLYFVSIFNIYHDYLYKNLPRSTFGIDVKLNQALQINAGLKITI